MDFDFLLQQCRAKFGPATRRIQNKRLARRLHIPLPEWIDQDEDLQLFFREYGKVLNEGYVTWGHTVQANGLLYQPGEENCPGEVLYCKDAEANIPPEKLQKLASSLYQLKGTNPDHQGLRPIAEHLTNEHTRVFGLNVPVRSNHSFALSTVFFDRSYLPERMLTASLYPVVVSTSGSGVVVPLPFEFWPEALLLWYRGVPESDIDNACLRVNYRKWISTVLTWDATIALLICLVPFILRFLMANKITGMVEVLVVLATVAAAVTRLYFGVQHIKANYCSTGMRFVQKSTLVLAMFLMAITEIMMILTSLLPAEGGINDPSDLMIISIIMAIYLALMTVAMYPGREWFVGEKGDRRSLSA